MFDYAHPRPTWHLYPELGATRLPGLTVVTATAHVRRRRLDIGIGYGAYRAGGHWTHGITFSLRLRPFTISF